MKIAKFKFYLSLLFALVIMMISLTSKSLFLEVYHYIIPIIFIGFIIDELILLIPKLNLKKISGRLFFKGNIKNQYNLNKLNNHVSKNNQMAFLIFVLYFGTATLVGLFYLHSNYLDIRFIMIIFVLINLGDYTSICIWCPFQSIFLKNHCCVSCRISNWDRLMKFYILLFIPSIYSIILVLLALIIFIEWEISHFFNPERFYSLSNQSLSCKGCNEQYCTKKIKKAA